MGGDLVQAVLGGVAGAASRPQQEFALHWVRALEKDNTACAYQFLTHAYRALIEAKRSGIHPFCITIDKEGQDYLPHMYGAVNYTIVDAGGEAALQGLGNLSAVDGLKCRAPITTREDSAMLLLKRHAAALVITSILTAGGIRA